MNKDAVYFWGHRCFRGEWAGFQEIKPINIVVGRNNTGKSHLLDLVEAISMNKLRGRGWKIRRCAKLEEESLKTVFRENTSHGELGGSHWGEHGQRFVGVEVQWMLDESEEVQDLEFHSEIQYESKYGEDSTRARLRSIEQLVKGLPHALSGRHFQRLRADRDVRPESPENDLILGAQGEGATNIIRRFITSSLQTYPREVIQRELLGALNEIFGNDGQFTEIQVQEHDEDPGDGNVGYWEVFLGEETKGLIPLSKSGSGLKTIILVLLNLLVIPKILEKEKSDLVFAFEELENNLHPALLRRLFRYLEAYAIENEAPLFLTTHSSVGLDFFGTSENANVTLVTHDGVTARTSPIAVYNDQLHAISELGVRPSDLLQANGIVWVEGPSDRIYINRWIAICSHGLLKEGRDYQCAFYGGALLARAEFKSPATEEANLANLLRVNSNIVVVCDSDRSSSSGRLKDRVKRVRDEVSQISNAYIWVTSAREIENYVPGEALAGALERNDLIDPEQYENLFASTRPNEKSYLERNVGTRFLDKIDLAFKSTPHMNFENMKQRFDWCKEMEEIVGKINSWNT